MNQITEAFSQGKYTLGYFIDLSKAFDTVNHNILIKNWKHLEWNLKTWNGLEASCQIENNLFCSDISKQKGKLLILAFAKVLY